MIQKLPISLKFGLNKTFSKLQFIKGFIGVEKTVTMEYLQQHNTVPVDKTVNKLITQVAENSFKAGQQTALEYLYQSTYIDAYCQYAQDNYDSLTHSVANQAVKQGVSEGFKLSRWALDSYFQGEFFQLRQYRQIQGDLTRKQRIQSDQLTETSQRLNQKLGELETEISEIQELDKSSAEFGIPSVLIPPRPNVRMSNERYDQLPRCQQEMIEHTEQETM
jgi:hypothetical protein